jgi:FlaA1/EpsC-like NDP-sugar epimerase
MPHISLTELRRHYLGARTGVVVHDLVMVSLAWWLAFLVRYDFSLDQIRATLFLITIPTVVIIQGVVLWWAGTYRGIWRFASIPDVWNIVRAALLGILITSVVLFLIDRLQGIPRSVLLLYPLLLILLLSAPRMLYRMWKSHSFSLPNINDRKHVLILGAGQSGELLARDMLHDNEYLPIGFLDDKAELKGTKIHGIPVVGTLDHLVQLVSQGNVDIIVIAIPSANAVQMRRIVALCEKTTIPFRTLPRIQDLISGQTRVSDLREVSIDDLLGREPVSLDWQRINAGLAGKTVMVSGAGGSIGAELCRQIAGLGVKGMVLFEHSEFNLYSIEMELRGRFPALGLQACLGDICDQAAVDHALAQYRPEIIFHAAAYKHVPMLELQAREAVLNNILGTKILAQSADRHHCTSFVMISTDKAVNPSSVMGTTKRIAEIFCQELNRKSSTQFITVRFGNVLGSAGSVVPLFQKQIAAGGPVTVTHPEMVRFFMTIPEACQLIMQAAVIGKGGEIYVLDMGEPVNITYLAEQMIKLAGKKPETDIEIVYTGLRPGEKLYEELFDAHESLAHTDHKKIFLAQCRDMDPDILDATLIELERACAGYNEPKIQELLKTLAMTLTQTKSVKSSNIINLHR